MTLQEFLKLNSNGDYLIIRLLTHLYDNNYYIDCYYKNELKDSKYLNKKIMAFKIFNDALEIEIEK